jgi:hypothetical protein
VNYRKPAAVVSALIFALVPIDIQPPTGGEPLWQGRVRVNNACAQDDWCVYNLFSVCVLGQDQKPHRFYRNFHC